MVIDSDLSLSERGHSEELLAFLREKSRIIRADVIRMLCAAGSGHPGGALSCVDILSALYFHHLRIDPACPQWAHRDRFVLSKGHACAALYATLAEAGYFSPEALPTLRQLNSFLQGHPDMKKAPGVDMSTGSLGQGISAAVGMALGGRLKDYSFHVYALIGDGESQSGQVWEAAMAAAHYHLDNLTVILDYNGLQIDGPVQEVMNIAPVAGKWRAFGWQVLEIDGHDMGQITAALDWALTVHGQPTFIVAHTIKGKGVSFMENVVEYHGKSLCVEERDRALEELEASER